MKEFNLREKLKTLEDTRRNQAKQHSIDTVLMITIMATMSNFQGYRAIGDFAVRYKDKIIKYLNIQNNKVPSFATIRRVLINIDQEKFGDIFTGWMQSNISISKNTSTSKLSNNKIKSKGKWISVDGKAIKGTKQKEEDKKLAHLVSFFKSDSKDILIARATASKSNEIPLVQTMMQEFPLKDFIITLDALHTQTKTLKAIKQSNNDYVVQIKENQKKL